MNHIRIFSSVINFTPFNYEHFVNLPKDDLEYLEDVRFVLHGQPTYFSESGRTGLGIEDVRVYLAYWDTSKSGLAAHDITPSVIAILKQNIDAEDQSRLRSQYESALTEWLKLEKKLGAAYPIEDPRTDEVAANNLLSTVPLSNVLRKLGDHTAGFSGNLHIFNYLYSQIDVAPISLVKVIEHYNQSASQGVILKKLVPLRFVFSLGPCRLFSNSWDPSSPIARGTLHCQIESIYHDYLEDILNRLEKTIKRRLDDINENIGPNGLIQSKLIPDLIRKLDAATQNIDNSNESLQSHQQQISALKVSVEDLKRAIDSLR